MADRPWRCADCALHERDAHGIRCRALRIGSPTRDEAAAWLEATSRTRDHGPCPAGERADAPGRG